MNGIACNEDGMAEQVTPEPEPASDSQPTENGDLLIEVECTKAEDEPATNIEDEKKDEAALNESTLSDEDNTEEKE